MKPIGRRQGLPMPSLLTLSVLRFYIDPKSMLFSAPLQRQYFSLFKNRQKIYSAQIFLFYFCVIMKILYTSNFHFPFIFVSVLFSHFPLFHFFLFLCFPPYDMSRFFSPEVVFTEHKNLLNKP